MPWFWVPRQCLGDPLGLLPDILGGGAHLAAHAEDLFGQPADGAHPRAFCRFHLVGEGGHRVLQCFEGLIDLRVGVDLAAQRLAFALQLGDPRLGGSCAHPVGEARPPAPRAAVPGAEPTG